MGYPIIDRELNRLIDDTALHAKNSREVFRKAGIRAEEATATFAPTRIRTVLDAWIIPDPIRLLYQWYVDFSDFERIRMSASASEALALYWAERDYSGFSGAFDPDAFSDLPATYIVGDNEVGEPLHWSPLPAELRRPLRVALAGFVSPVVPIHPNFFEEPFTVTLQAF